MIVKQSFPAGWLILTGIVISLNVQAAPTAPDAGQTIRELKQEREPVKPKSVEPLMDEGSMQAPTGVQDNTPIPVSKIYVTGSSFFTPAQLEALVADLIGGTHTLSELEAGAARITTYYREHGYFLTNAYIPAQDIKEGVLQIAVQEGKLDQLKLNNTSRVSDARVQAHLNVLNNGDALQQTYMDRKLLLLRDTIGVGSVRATLQPGATVGTSDLLVETTPSAPYNGRVQFDNYGNRYTGEYRIGSSLAINSPFKLGDQLSARVLGSNDHMAYAHVAYQLPIGGDGLRIGAGYSYTEYQLGNDFKSLGAHGTSTGGSLFTSYPFVLSQTSSLIGNFTYDDKTLNDHTDSTATSTDKQVQSFTLGFTGNHQDTLNGSGQSSLDVSVVSGQVSMDSVSRTLDASSARSNGQFTKATYMVNRLQRVTDSNTVSASFGGQWAEKNLNSSDKYSLGGPYGVRAYPQGEASGDEGNMLNLELRHRFIPQLQGMLFYDYGQVQINHNQFAASSNKRSIAGAGVGFNAELFGRLQLNSYLAWRTQGGTPESEPASAERTPRLWVQLSGEF